MSTISRPQRPRLIRRRRHGQSIPIIALMILVLIAMVGLSVDVGNTFSQERKAVSASNAAAISAMTTYLKHSTNAITDGAVYTSIRDSLTNNGMTIGDGTSGTVQVAAYYLNSQGEILPERPTIIEDSGQTVPSNVAYIQVKLNGQVDTSFARAVGRNQLPIGASAHAGLCQATNGIYPLAVDTKYLNFDTGKFNTVSLTQPVSSTEYKTVTSGTFAGYTQRRLYVSDNTAPGSFSWLRWTDTSGSTSAPTLAASLTGSGNIADAFQEAPWPSGVTGKTAGYPIDPGIPTVGDWIWGSPGWKNSNAVDAGIDALITAPTRMILPIYDTMLSSGSNVQVHVIKFGTFVITAKSSQGGANAYIDLIYLGDPVNMNTACMVTPPPPASSNMELFGNVSFYPEYQIVPEQRDPVQYIVVLDTSGSMSANFNGQCNNSGGVQQCANGPTGAPAVQVTNTGNSYWWTTLAERRIYVAKTALQRLVSLTNMSGNTGYTTTRPSDQMAVVWFNDSVPSGNTLAFSTNPTTIKTFITNANNGNGRSSGGTNGAAALYRASLLYGPAAKTISIGATTWTYKRVVLFITDGVSNQFLDTTANDLSGGQSSDTTYPSGTFCHDLGSKVVESAACQTTDVGGKYTKSTNKVWDRPITQMIYTSQTFLRNTTVNASVFVIALSSIPSTGLDTGVASSTSYFFPAERLVTDPATGKTNVDGIIDTINSKVQLGDCIPGPNGATSGVILSNQFVSGSSSGGFSYPNVGQVQISNGTTTLSTYITADAGGTLSYHFLDVPPGTYTMVAQLYYSHPLDPPDPVTHLPVVRQYLLSSFAITLSPSTQSISFLQRVDQPLTLRLNGNVCP